MKHSSGSFFVLNRLIAGLSVLALGASAADAQTLSAPATAPTNSPGSNIAGPVSLLSNYEFWLTISVLIFGLMFLIVSNRAISKASGSEPEHVIRTVSVILIVIGTLVTITAGLSDKQIAPAFGLFGTIAGYLLGRSERKNTDKTDEKSSPDPPEVRP